MPASYILTRMIRNEMKKLSKPVSLILFIDKVNNRENYEFTRSILKAYEENSNGMLTIKEIQFSHNEDLVKKYDIQHVPTILFIDDNGNEIIRYLATPQGSEVQPFIQTLLVYSGFPNYYENAIKENLNKIETSTIKVLISDSCAFCASVVDIVSKFALASNGRIKANIIDIKDNPDIGENYDVCSVPYIIINEKIVIDGKCTPNEILEAIMGETSNK
ncbi:MAG: thioredoxin family protein [Candidatus Hermodarchaeota archaeon]